MRRGKLAFASSVNVAVVTYIYLRAFVRGQVTLRAATISNLCKDFHAQTVVLAGFFVTAVITSIELSSLMPMAIIMSLTQCFRYHEKTSMHKMWAWICFVSMVLSLNALVLSQGKPTGALLPLLWFFPALVASFHQRNSAAMGVTEVGFLLTCQSLVWDLI